MNIDIKTLNLNELYQLRTELNNYIAEIETVARKKLEEGKDIKGYALKEGAKRRIVGDERKLSQAYAEQGGNISELYETKMKGITALIKLFNTNLDKEVSDRLIAQFMVTKQSDPVLTFIGISNE